MQGIFNGPNKGRPSIFDENVARVKAFVRKNRRLTAGKICEMIPDVSEITFYKILTEHLGYHKSCARWVPCMLSDEHKRKRVDFPRTFCAVRRGKEEFLDSIGFFFISLNQQVLQLNN